MSVIEPGSPAPEFVLHREDGSTLGLDDLRGQTSVLVFYPFAFSPVCTDQLQVYDEVRGELAEHGATFYGVSCDHTYSQSTFHEHLNIKIEQLSN